MLLDGIVVSFVLDDSSGWEIENPPERVPDPVGDGSVAGRAVPNR
jgi:hypothetical protein